MLNRRRFFSFGALLSGLVPLAEAQQTHVQSTSLLEREINDFLVPDGSTTVFTLTDTPTSPVVAKVVRNGLTLRRGVDYDLVGKTLTFFTSTGVSPPPVPFASVVNPPQTGESVWLYYKAVFSV